MKIVELSFLSRFCLTGLKGLERKDAAEPCTASLHAILFILLFESKYWISELLSAPK